MFGRALGEAPLKGSRHDFARMILRGQDLGPARPWPRRLQATFTGQAISVPPRGTCAKAGDFDPSAFFCKRWGIRLFSKKRVPGGPGVLINRPG